MKYTADEIGGDVTDLIKLSISGGSVTDSYDFTYSIPYWAPNSYQQHVFIKFQINQFLNGSELLYLYIDNIYVTDANGYQLLKRNSTSKQEYLPMNLSLLG